MANFLIGRTLARAQAVQILFQAEVQSVDVFELFERGEYALEEGPLDKYAEKLARGVATNKLAIDRIMGGVSQNWNLSRMPLVDRSIMSIAIYELFFIDDVPDSVAISEAVELSKVFGTDDSSSFVNGILGRIERLKQANPETPLMILARDVAEDDVIAFDDDTFQDLEDADLEGADLEDAEFEDDEPLDGLDYEPVSDDEAADGR